MSIEKPNNERMKLYERFRQSLAEGDDTQFFDADDLIIIIDQAVDLEDEYVQIEALMRAYRYFPDNQELANRRAFLYYDLHLDGGVENMVRHHSDDSPLWDILKLRLAEDNPEDAAKTLDRILATPGKFDDEMVIQFVDCASACGQYQWLKDHEAALRKKTEYLPSLLYELFIVADLQHDNEYSIKLLEELTEIEPFNADFWFALAQTQCNMERFDDALASIDYALAIDSDNAGVLALQASIFIRCERNQEALDILEPLHASAPDHIIDELRIRAYYGLGLTKSVYEALTEAAAAYPTERVFPELALFADHPESHAILQQHYDAIADEERDKWMVWASECYAAGHLMQAICIFQILMVNNALPYRGIKMMISAALCSGQYDACVEMLKLAVENHNFLVPDVVVAGFLSLVKLRKKRDLKSLYKKVMAAFPMQIMEPWSVSTTLENLGFSSFMSIIQRAVDSSTLPDFDDINIFHFPSVQ